MPELPAKNTGQSGNADRPAAERLATPQELAEFGSIASDPVMEAQILALFEAQMKEEVPTEASGGAYSSTMGETLAEARTNTPVETTLETAKTETTGKAREAREVKAAEPEIAVVPIPLAEAQAEAELPAGHRATGEDLLELAEVLDQHQLWAESSGKEGVRGEFSGANLAGVDLTAVNLQGASLQKVNLRGADLSMANLRGTDLVEADLRETNLLGAEFSGANLMGANLYGAQGLWAGRLGGTNLFDATLPEAVSAHDGGKTIGQFTQSARWFYLLLVGLCIVACGLIALTTDLRLLLDASAAPTARIPNFLPLQGFYLGAPLLLAVFYLRLQFLLLRLWGSMGALPAVFPDGQTPEKDGSWYLMGPIRTHLKWSRDPRSPLSQVEGTVAKLLAYWGVPAILFFFWLRYLVLQDYRGTLLHVFLFTLACVAACGLPRIVARVLRPGDWSDESTSTFVKEVLSALRKPMAAGLVMFLFSLGVIRGLPPDMNIRPEVVRGDPRRWAATVFQSVGFRPYADITGESVSKGPVNAASDAAPQEANGARLNEINLRYARGYRAAFANARMWRANLEGASLSEADFRGANLREANLRSAQLDRLQAEKANLVSANARGAVLSGAGFQNADLSYADLEGATLTTADMTRATLYAVNLRHANLLRTQLAHADLRDVKLEDANLSLALLEQTDLSAAKLMGANLTGAEAKGTIFLEADLSRADLRGGNFAGAILRQARLDGANLEGADLRGVLGLATWQVCSTHGWRNAQLDLDVKLAAEQGCSGQ